MKSFTTVDGEEFYLVMELVLGFYENSTGGFFSCCPRSFLGRFNLIPITKESFDREGKTKAFFLLIRRRII